MWLSGDSLIKIGQIVGAVAIVENLFVFAMKKRSNILVLKLISDVLWLTNYLCLGALTGSVINAIAIFREIIIFNKGKKKFASHRIWMYVFLLAAFISPTVEWLTSGFSFTQFFPAAGTMLLIFALYNDNPLYTKYIVLAGQCLWLIYTVMIGNTMGTIANVITIISALIGISRHLIEKYRSRKTKEA